jgi:hypothetical protein
MREMKDWFQPNTAVKNNHHLPHCVSYCPMSTYFRGVNAGVAIHSVISERIILDRCLVSLSISPTTNLY